MEQPRLTSEPKVPGAPEPAFLTIAEAARTVRCCERTLRRAIPSGALRAGRIGGARGWRDGYRIRAADRKDWAFGDGA
jgi:excisionase family DNA binding protein